MGQRIEWARANDGADVLTPEQAQTITDQYGSTVDAGHGAIVLDGIVIEGTPTELVDFTTELANAARRAAGIGR